MTVALLDPCESLAAWSTTVGWSIVAGRTANGFSVIGTPVNNYTIPAALESATITLGLAWQVSSLAAQRGIVQLVSDAGATQHVAVVVNTDGSISARRGTVGGTLIGTTATGLITTGTWYYVEVQVVMSDTVGVVNINVDGVSRLALTGQDTKNAGTKTVYDTVRLLAPGSGVTTKIDDIYVATGGGESFRGSLAIVSGGTTSAAVAFSGTATGTIAGAFTADATVTFSGTATGTVTLVGAGTATITFTGDATGTVTAAPAGTATVAFTAAATGTVTSPPAGTATLTFSAAATGHKVLAAAGAAGMTFRAFAHYFLGYRDLGAWATPTTTTLDLVSGSISPTPGALLVVLYAERVDGIATLLTPDSAWGPNGAGNVVTAVDDTLATSGEWRAWVGGNFRPGPAGGPYSWMVAAAYAEVGAAPGSGTVTVHGQRPGHPTAQWMTVVEVVGWKHATTGAATSLVIQGGSDLNVNLGSEYVDALSAGSASAKDEGLYLGLVMADDVVASPVITPPRTWASLHHATTAPEMEVATGAFRIGHHEAELSPAFRWEAAPTSAYVTQALTLYVPSVSTAPPVPTPFAEFMVEFLDATGRWVDITCDVRTCDIDTGRQDVLEAFAAGTLTLTMANFEGLYSAWPTDSIWEQAGPYRTDVPIRVNMLTLSTVGGVTTLTPHPLFTGTTDAVADSWPDTVDALATVTASDGFKKLARYEGVAAKNPDGSDVTVGAGESTGTRISRWAFLAGWNAPDPAVYPEIIVDYGVATMQATNMAGNALQAMQGVAFAEGLGVLYVQADGRLVSRQRTAALLDPRQNTVQATFTDRDDDPEGACYSDIVPVADETAVYNVAQMASAGHLVQTAADPTSVAWFGPRTYPPNEDLGLAEWNDDLSVAILVVYTHANTERRIERVVINPGFDQTLWSFACTLRLLDRVRVVRHFPGGYVLDRELAVEGVHHHLEGTGTRVPGIWEVTYDTAKALPMTDGVSFCGWDVGEWDVCSWSV